jgi:mevalonate kinase
MPTTIRASAPGSLMLFGEHAVLHGRRALVAAVERRVHVMLTPRSDARVVLRSALGDVTTDLADCRVPPALRFVGAAIAHRRASLASGFELAIESAIDPTLGFGSSAAVTVATLAALARMGGDGVDAARLLDDSVGVIRAVQGRGSGADAAASVHGGFVLYRADPRSARRLAHAHPLTAAYSGTKVATPEVIAHVERARAAQPRVFEALFDAIDACTGAAADAVDAQDWPALGALMDVAQGLMHALGVSTPRLAAIVAALRAAPGGLGAKISGAGLGDCAVALGHVDARGAEQRHAGIAPRATAGHASAHEPTLRPIAVEVAAQGVQVDAR